MLDDPNPGGDGPGAPIDATISFNDLPEGALRVRIDTAIEISLAARDERATPAGSASELVDACAGRAPLAAVLDRLPNDLAAQLSRAALVL